MTYNADMETSRVIKGDIAFDLRGVAEVERPRAARLLANALNEVAKLFGELVQSTLIRNETLSEGASVRLFLEIKGDSFLEAEKIMQAVADWAAFRMSQASIEGMKEQDTGLVGSYS